MESIQLRGVPYQFSTSIREEGLCQSFNQLTRLTYGFDFTRWQAAGLWTHRYQPHCLLHGGQVVANVSVNQMRFLWGDKSLSMIQLGTVMTHPDFRGQGLSRYLMERVLREWAGKADLVYLFANHTVLDFYPKFGFIPMGQTLFSREIPAGQKGEARHLDPEREVQLIRHLAEEGKPQGRIQMVDNCQLALFHLLGPYRDCLYHLPQLDALAVAQREGDALLLWEVFAPGPIPLDKVLAALAQPGVTRAVLGFTPWGEGFCQTALPGEDDQLFAQGPALSLLGKRPFCFPALSHA